MKWAQDLIIFNPVLTNYGKPEKIYVNMPKEFDFLIEMVNAELQTVENPLVYELLIADELYDESIATNLDLYGGFYARLYNKTNCF